MSMVHVPAPAPQSTSQMTLAARRRPKGVLAMGWACFESAARGRTEHAPTSADYPDTVVRRTTFIAGGGHGWQVSALETPRATPAPWKIVVITGARPGRNTGPPCWPPSPPTGR